MKGRRAVGAQADVNVRMVMNLRANVKKRVNITEVAAGLNARRIIEKAVYDELCAMLDGCASKRTATLALTPTLTAQSPCRQLLMTVPPWLPNAVHCQAGCARCLELRCADTVRS